MAPHFRDTALSAISRVEAAAGREAASWALVSAEEAELLCVSGLRSASGCELKWMLV